tara:strand:- start:520 stop:1167 length:648 start_codon:yes stop_codon:yes gene_type:complete
MAETGTGKFITFEGGEGAGKSTQVRLLADALQSLGISTVLTREPGGAPGAEKIRTLLLDSAAEWDPQTETLLHFAARADHYTSCISPALKSGQWVICDRFADSTRAYQGYGLGVSASAIDTLYDITLGTFRPDLTLVLDLPVTTGMQRIGARAGAADRYERMNPAFHERLRRGFLEIAAKEPERCVVLDADTDIGILATRILECVENRLLPATAS